MPFHGQRGASVFGGSLVANRGACGICCVREAPSASMTMFPGSSPVCARINTPLIYMYSSHPLRQTVEGGHCHRTLTGIAQEKLHQTVSHSLLHGGKERRRALSTTEASLSVQGFPERGASMMRETYLCLSSASLKVTLMHAASTSSSLTTHAEDVAPLGNGPTRRGALRS